MELKKELTLGERIKTLRLSLQKPYYFFSAMESGEIYLVFEDQEEERVSFREKSMMGAVAKAEDFLEASKIRAGQQEKLKEQETPKEIPQEQKKEQETPTIETKTAVRDDKGNLHPLE